MFENLPRTLTILKDTKQVITGGVAFVVLLAISLGMLVSGNGIMAAAFGFFSLMILIGVGANLMTILNLRQAPDSSFTSFQTNTNVTYRVPDYAVGSQVSSAAPPQYAAPPAEVPFFAGAPSPVPVPVPAAVPVPVPTPAPTAAPLPAGIAGWVGPIFVHDGAVAGWEILGKEVDKSGGNTLVFTQAGIIVMMLGPADMPNSGAGELRGILGNILEFAPEAAFEKTVQFESLYVDKWATMMAPLLADLPTTLAGHFNYTLPFAAIERIEVSSGMTNPGLKVHLRTGKTVKFVALRPTQLPAAAAALRAYVPVS